MDSHGAEENREAAKALRHRTLGCSPPMHSEAFRGPRGRRRPLRARAGSFRKRQENKELLEKVTASIGKN